MVQLFNFAVITIFAREVLEASIIIGEYRTIILRANCVNDQNEALRAVTVAALVASAVAVVICVAIAVPLALMSRNFDAATSKVIEGISKIIAAVCLLQLSLKLPKFLGLYCSKKKPKQSGESSDEGTELSLRRIRFDVAWNIWREVAECGVFLIPFFLRKDVLVIPLSAVVGTVVGLLAGLGIYFANKRFKKKIGLAIFTSLLLLILSAGLFTGGCNNLEKVFGSTPTLWCLHGAFWSVDRLPMTIFKPFGYSDCRTILQMVAYWTWLALAAILHMRKIQYTRSKTPDMENPAVASTANDGNSSASSLNVENEHLERAESGTAGKLSIQCDEDVVEVDVSPSKKNQQNIIADA